MTVPENDPLVRRYGIDVALFLVVVAVLTLGPFAALLAAPPARPSSSPWFVVLTFAPTIAALVLWVVTRRRPRSDRLGRLRWRPWYRWVPAAILLGAVPVVLGALVDGAAGGPGMDLGQPAAKLAAAGPVGAVAMLLLAGPLAEEPGWRGYLQPRLGYRWSPLVVTVAVGVVWAVWHLPLFAVPGTSQASRGPLSGALALLVFVPLASVFWLVSERLQGGVVGAVLTHVAFNAASALLGSDTVVATAAELAALVVVAAVIHVVTRRRVARGPG